LRIYTVQSAEAVKVVIKKEVEVAKVAKVVKVAKVAKVVKEKQKNSVVETKNKIDCFISSINE
jgi:hypothetical protein